jgi:hypothetical protein
MKEHRSKRISWLLLAAMLFLTGCAGTQTPAGQAAISPTATVSETPDTNYIAPYEPDEDENALINLLFLSDRVKIFSFDTDGSFSKVSISCDKYINGKLASSEPDMNCELDKYSGRSGKIAVIITDDATLKISIDAGKTSVSRTGDIQTTVSDGVNGSYWADMSGVVVKTAVENGTGIPMFAYATSRDDSVMQQPGILTESPALIGNYDYCYLMTCTFT